MSEEKKPIEETTQEQPQEEVVNEVSVETQLPPELTDEQIEFARLNLQRDFNKRFGKWAVIADEKADDDFIAEAKKDLEEAADIIRNRTFQLAPADGDLPLKTAEFLKEWNDHFNHWEKGEWRGIIHFNRVITKAIEDLKANPDKEFDIDYPSLIFLYNSMKTPSGTGLESARLIAKFENYNEETDAPFDNDSFVTYSGILERIFNYVRELSAYDKKLAILKQRVDLAYATAKMVLKIDTIEEFLEFHEEITKGILPENDEQMKKELREVANS